MKGIFAPRGLLAAIAMVLVLGITPAAEGQKPVEPKIESLTTKDGVELKVTYYASTEGKNATPVILLPDLKDSRSVVDSLARHMANPDPKQGDTHKSFAVVAVDLRGHGDSTRQLLQGGERRTVDAAKLTRDDLAAMVQSDMEAVRRFLVNENDEGRLNINRLSIVGAGLGATVAVNWAAVDWSAPPLAVGKQGQDVKALVLLSPAWKNKGLTLQNALRHPGVRQEIAFCMLYGDRDRQTQADVKRIEKQLERYHPAPKNPSPDEPHDLVALGAPTGLQGTKLLKEGGVEAENTIIKFLVDHVQSKDFEWTERRRR